MIKILFISALFSQGEFQIKTIPSNAFMLSNHKHYFVQLAVYHRILGKLQKFNPKSNDS